MSGNNVQDPISRKKLNSSEGQWEVRQELLDWMVNGATRCIELARDKQSTIYADLNNIVRMTKRGGIQMNEKLIGKIKDAAPSVQTGKKLMTPINKILQVKPQIVWWKYFPAANQEF